MTEVKPYLHNNPVHSYKLALFFHLDISNVGTLRIEKKHSIIYLLFYIINISSLKDGDTTCGPLGSNVIEITDGCDVSVE